MASKEINYKDHTFTISYELVNPKEKKSILILHGWGSNKEIMRQAFGKSMPEYRHIYVDMPGFGKSSNEIVLETQDYADIIRVFLDSIRADIDIAMGHSFGGKVSTLLNPPTLVLLSSSGILVPKELAVRAKIALFKILKPLGVSKLRQLFISDDAKGMSQNMYETFKIVVNERFEENFTKVDSDTLLFWGESDTATPLWSGEKIANMIKNSRLYPLEGDHFFFLKHSDFIAEKISNTYKEQ
jgi:pimeloyl-ACP methyl ester carboxylesterase